jgi:hypothetical protein
MSEKWNQDIFQRVTKKTNIPQFHYSPPAADE